MAVWFCFDFRPEGTLDCQAFVVSFEREDWEPGGSVIVHHHMAVTELGSETYKDYWVSDSWHWNLFRTPMILLKQT